MLRLSDRSTSRSTHHGHQSRLCMQYEGQVQPAQSRSSASDAPPQKVRGTAPEGKRGAGSSHSPPNRPARPPPPIPSAPRSPSIIAPRRESPSAEQSSAASRRAIRSGSRASGASVEGYPRTHSPRHSRHPHLPFAVNERAHLEFCRERGVRAFFSNGPSSVLLLGKEPLGTLFSRITPGPPAHSQRSGGGDGGRVGANESSGTPALMRSPANPRPTSYSPARRGAALLCWGLSRRGAMMGCEERLGSVGVWAWGSVGWSAGWLSTDSRAPFCCVRTLLTSLWRRVAHR